MAPSRGKKEKVKRTELDFMSIISHQLRTPLTTINWYLETLAKEIESKLTSKQKEYLKTVYQSSKRMGELVTDLLNAAHLETGGLKVVPQAIQIETLIKKIVKEIQPWDRKKKCRIIFNKPKPRLPKIIVDPGLLRQIIYNLLINALRYSLDKKKSIITINTKPKKIKGRKYLVISITDQGIGIPKEEQTKLFQKFYRGANAIQAVSQGTGLGLYICRLISKACEGKIWFRSQIKKGTTFYLALPFKGMKKKPGDKVLLLPQAKQM